MSAASPLKVIRDYFGMSLAEMKAEWTPLPADVKAQLIEGITNGTETY
jgi:hypothetical protein